MIRFLYFIFSLMYYSHVFALETPRIINKKGIVELELGSDAKKALNIYDPTFRVLNNSNYVSEVLSQYNHIKDKTPYSLIGDFNEDQVNDLIVIGASSNSAQPKVVALLLVTNSSKYDVFLVENWSSKQYLKWVENKKGQKNIALWPIYLKELSAQEKKVLRSEKLLMVPENRKGFKTVHIKGSGQPYYFLKNKIYTFFKTPAKKK